MRAAPEEVIDAAPSERAQQLLLEAGRRLAGTLNQQRCLRTTVELAVRHLADAAVAVGPVDGLQADWVRLVTGGPVETYRAYRHEFAEVPGLTEALANSPPLPAQRLDPAAAPDWLWPASLGPVGDLLLVPMAGNAIAGGALLLARRAGGRSPTSAPGAAAGGGESDALAPDGPRFTAEETALARTFATQAGAAVAAATLYREQSEATAVLRADLTNPELPRLAGVELAGGLQPAEDGLQVGGDFYDVLPPAGPSAQALVVLGDVAGSGVAAAALAGRVRQSLRALHLVEQHPATLLRVLNQALQQPMEGARFVTLMLGSLTRAPHGRIRLTFATGGHPPPLLLRADGSVEVVPASGALIAVMPEPQFQAATAELGPGELCLLYSDGITEARGGPTGREEYGEQRLRDALAGCWGMPADATVERIRQLASEWVGPGEHDDIAVLAIRADLDREAQ